MEYTLRVRIENPPAVIGEPSAVIADPPHNIIFATPNSKHS